MINACDSLGDEEEKPQVAVRLDLSEEGMPCESDIALSALRPTRDARIPAILLF